MNLAELLEALESRVDGLLLENRKLAAELQRQAAGAAGQAAPVDTEEEMKRRKPAADSPEFGMLFPELDPPPETLAASEPPDVEPEGEEDSATLAENDANTSPSGRRKRSPGVAKRAQKPPEPSVEPEPADAPEWVTSDALSEDPAAPVALTTAGEPESIGSPAAELSPDAEAQADEYSAADVVPTVPPEPETTEQIANEPTPMPVAPAASVEGVTHRAEVPPARPPHPFVTAVPTPAEAVPSGSSPAAPPAVPTSGRLNHPFVTSVAEPPQPVAPAATAETLLPQPEVPWARPRHPFVTAVSTPAEAVPSGTSPAPLPAVPTPGRSSHPFRTSVPESAQTVAPPASVAVPPAQSTHPFASPFSQAAATPISSSGPVSTNAVVPRAAVRDPDTQNGRRKHPFALETVTRTRGSATEYATNPVPRPAVSAPARPTSSRKHPFSEFAVAKAAAPREVVSASDVHWSFPAKQSQSSNRRPDTLRTRMEKAGLSREELADSLGVTTASIDNWLAGTASTPAWVFSSLRVLELLSPQARRSARARATAEAGSQIRKSVGKEREGRSHPFAKIEEL